MGRHLLHTSLQVSERLPCRLQPLLCSPCISSCPSQHTLNIQRLVLGPGCALPGRYRQSGGLPSSPPSDLCLRPPGPSPGLLRLTEDTSGFGQLLASSVRGREGTLDVIQQEGDAGCPALGEGHS